MKRTIIIILIAFTGLATVTAQTAMEITDKSSKVIEYESLEMVSTLKIYDARGSERIRQITMATKKFGDVNKTMIKFISPADVKGTAMLIYDYETTSDDMWIYMPALHKTRRIVSTEKGKNFMGSEFTNADMSKPNLKDFQYKILSTEDYDGNSCWKIESVCNTQAIADENGYSKKISYIEKETYLCHKVEFYDMEGKLYKTEYMKQYKKQSNGKYFSFLMVMKNEQNGRKSVMVIDKFQTGSGLSENAFTAAMLEK